MDNIKRIDAYSIRCHLGSAIPPVWSFSLCIFHVHVWIKYLAARKPVGCLVKKIPNQHHSCLQEIVVLAVVMCLVVTWASSQLQGYSKFGSSPIFTELSSTSTSMKVGDRSKVRWLSETFSRGVKISHRYYRLYFFWAVIPLEIHPYFYCWVAFLVYISMNRILSSKTSAYSHSLCHSYRSNKSISI